MLFFFFLTGAQGEVVTTRQVMERHLQPQARPMLDGKAAESQNYAARPPHGTCYCACVVLAKFYLQSAHATYFLCVRHDRAVYTSNGPKFQQVPRGVLGDGLCCGVRAETRGGFVSSAGKMATIGMCPVLALACNLMQGGNYGFIEVGLGAKVSCFKLGESIVHISQNRLRQFQDDE